MSNPWDDIKDLKPDLKNPKEIVDEMFSPIYPKTGEKVIYKLINSGVPFPEEVVEKNISQKILRYTLLLFPTSDPNIHYELFKFKYPLFFYPVQFFIDINSFRELEGFVHEDFNQVVALNEQDLFDVISTIIKSETTIKLIRRLMAL